MPDIFDQIHNAALRYQRGQTQDAGDCTRFAPCIHAGEETTPRVVKERSLRQRKCRVHDILVSPCRCRACKAREASVSVSAIINARNEGTELAETVWSLWDETGVDEVLIADDASDDGSLDVFIDDRPDRQTSTRRADGIHLPQLPRINVARNDPPRGCNQGRNHAAKATTGNALALLDAHMRISGQRIRQLAEEAVAGQAIVQPASRGLEFETTFHCSGAEWNMTPGQEMPFTLQWCKALPVERWERCPGMMGGCYVFPRAVFDRIGGVMENGGLWGFSEEIVSMKASLCDIPVVRARDISSRHWYGKPRGFALSGYETWASRFAGLKIVLTPATFDRLLPEMKGRYWNPRIAELLARPELAEEHKAFQKIRRHPDRWFFETFLPKGEKTWSQWLDKKT